MAEIALYAKEFNIEKAVAILPTYSGKIGDGKIFVSSIEEVLRIRTGEKGSDAV